MDRMEQQLKDLEIVCPECKAPLCYASGRAVAFRCSQTCKYRITYRQAQGYIAAELHFRKMLDMVE